jgi:hypothetical protein
MANQKYANLGERIIANSIVEYCAELGSDCWTWVAAKKQASYSAYGAISLRIKGRRRSFLAHRISYEFFTGDKIPPKHEIDHLCRNPLCVAPDHLDCVDRKTNLSRRRSRS